LRPIEAIIEAQRLIIAGINTLLENTDCEIVIPCSVGNHSRINARQRHATEAGNSLEWYMYHNIALYFKDEKRITMLISKGYHNYLDVYGKLIRFHHGHGIRYYGGVGGIYIPVNKAIAQWNKGRRADLEILAHYHQLKDGGDFICNGSLIGYNAFALSIKADYEPPRQAFFIIHSTKGRLGYKPIFVE